MTQGTNSINTKIKERSEEREKKISLILRNINKLSTLFIQFDIHISQCAYFISRQLKRLNIYSSRDSLCLRKKKHSHVEYIYAKALVNSKFKLYKSRIDCDGFFSARVLCSFQFQSIPIPNDSSLQTFGKCLSDKF